MELRGTLLILLHLAFWAQVGVITRAFLTQFFVIGCSGQWGPCLTGAGATRARVQVLPVGGGGSCSRHAACFHFWPASGGAGEAQTPASTPACARLLCSPSPFWVAQAESISAR